MQIRGQILRHFAFFELLKTWKHNCCTFVVLNGLCLGKEMMNYWCDSWTLMCINSSARVNWESVLSTKESYLYVDWRYTENHPWKATRYEGRIQEVWRENIYKETKENLDLDLFRYHCLGYLINITDYLWFEYLKRERIGIDRLLLITNAFQHHYNKEGSNSISTQESHWEEQWRYIILW